MTRRPKSNALGIEVGKAYWDEFPDTTRASLIKLLQNGQRPQSIEDNRRKYEADGSRMVEQEKLTEQ